MLVERIPIKDRASWLQMRAHDVTASDVGALFGADPYKTPMKLMAEKRGLISGENDNSRLRGGRWLEPAVIEAVRLENADWDVRKATVYLRAPAERVGATPDAVAVDGARSGIGNIQCKVISSGAFKRGWLDGSAVVAPPHYVLQTTQENMLVDAAWGALAVLVIGEYVRDLHIIPVERHEKAETKIVRAVEQFWDMHDSGLWPDPNYARDKSMMELRFKQDHLPTFELRGDAAIEALLDERELLVQSIRAQYERKDEIEARLMEKMGGATLAFLSRGRMTYKTETKREHWVEESSSRVLRVSWKAKGED